MLNSLPFNPIKGDNGKDGKKFDTENPEYALVDGDGVDFQYRVDFYYTKIYKEIVV